MAGRQLAFLIRQLGYQQLGTILPAALPCVLATTKDQSPAVQCYGLHALRHIAEGECKRAWLLAAVMYLTSACGTSCKQGQLLDLMLTAALDKALLSVMTAELMLSPGVVCHECYTDGGSSQGYMFLTKHTCLV